ncbi:MAG TPA: CotH kinase family protein [Chthoniobacteraceae bacterium]
MNHRFTVLIFAFLLIGARLANAGGVVINEIYYDPQEKTKQSRFVELYNSSDAAVDLSKWHFANEIQYIFPDGTSIAPHGFTVVAQNLQVFAAEFGADKPALGPFSGGFHRHGGKVELHDAHDALVDQVDYKVGFPWPTAAGGAGSSLELINPELPRDNPASWRSSGYSVLFADTNAADVKLDRSKARPTPDGPNRSFSEHLPPVVDQVAHMPKQPHAGEPLSIGARVRAAAGLRSVTLLYQIVEPGSYIRRSSPNYERNWTEVPMNDEGRDGDAHAGDSIYTAVLPASVSINRRLIRYRILAEDASGAKVRVPYEDDACSNFAAFVYNGPPDWTGSVEPGKTPPLTFPSALMKTLPSLILIADKTDVEHSQWDPGANKEKNRGTVIVGDQVYDNVLFHNRGQASTFVSGKNKWGFKFDRGHNVEAHDMYGRPFAHGWDNMPMNACASPWVQGNRGMAGLDEAVSMRMYELAGDPASRVRPVQYRIIDSPEEASPKDQYTGDLWGLYLIIEEPDGSFLETRGLPEGNVYRIAGGGGDRKHQAPDQPADVSDWDSFRDACHQNQTESWWREHLDLPAFYAFHAMNRILGNVDLREADNQYFYHRPDGHWTIIPWDLDMMFVPKSHQSMRVDQDNCLQIPALRVEYKNRCRELLDLLCTDGTPNGGQIGQVVDEYASIVHPAGFKLAWPELDECMWDYNPHTNEKGAFYRNPAPGGADHNWTRTLATPDFFGFTKFIVDYCTDNISEAKWKRDSGNPTGYGYGYLRDEAKDSDVPNRPTITSVGDAGFAVNNLRFQCSPFAGPRGAQGFAAMQWRIGEISAPGIPGYIPGKPRRFEVEETWTSPEITEFKNEIQIPANAVRAGATYRARVRMKDDAGRWSRWSEAVQFVAETAKVAQR